ncbi:MAG: hypothetical protein ACJ757_07580 [Gaiellaceae bacterium]
MIDLRTPLAALVATGAVLVALACAGVASAAGGTHTQSFTDNVHGTQTSTQLNPCNGDVVDISSTSNIVNHVTFFPGSDEVWFTFTEEDKVTAVDEGTGVVYSGHDTVWGNLNINKQNQNSTFTNMIHVTGSDGSTILYHEVTHFTMLPNGDVSVSFDRPTLSCS